MRKIIIYKWKDNEFNLGDMPFSDIVFRLFSLYFGITRYRGGFTLHLAFNNVLYDVCVLNPKERPELISNIWADSENIVKIINL